MWTNFAYMHYIWAHAQLVIFCSNKFTFDVAAASWVGYKFLISSNIVPEQENSLFVLLVTHFRVLCCNSEIFLLRDLILV